MHPGVSNRCGHTWMGHPLSRRRRYPQTQIQFTYSSWVLFLGLTTHQWLLHMITESPARHNGTRHAGGAGVVAGRLPVASVAAVSSSTSTPTTSQCPVVPPPSCCCCCQTLALVDTPCGGGSAPGRGGRRRGRSPAAAPHAAAAAELGGRVFGQPHTPGADGMGRAGAGGGEMLPVSEWWKEGGFLTVCVLSTD